MIKTLKINICSRPELCKSRVVYSKSSGLCESCRSCRKPCSNLEKIPRRWTEKKRDGHFVRVEGFEIDSIGHNIAFTSNIICPLFSQNKFFCMIQLRQMCFCSIVTAPSYAVFSSTVIAFFLFLSHGTRVGQYLPQKWCLRNHLFIKLYFIAP